VSLRHDTPCWVVDFISTLLPRLLKHNYIRCLTAGRSIVYQGRNSSEQIEGLRRKSAAVIKGNLIVPQYSELCNSSLPDTFLKLMGINSARPLQLESLSKLCESTENLAFILLDGFGYRLAEHAITSGFCPSLASFLGERGTTFIPITTVFPSTTSTATTSLHTGLTPQEHGILGYTMYLHEVGTIAEMLRFAPLVAGGSNSIFDLGLDPKSFVGGETIHERMEGNGIRANLYINKWIVDSGLSRVTNRGARIHPHVMASDMFVRMRKTLEAGAGAKSFHFAYLSSPDTLAHAYGPFCDEFAAEVDSLFYMLQKLLVEKLEHKVARETAIVISADHGLARISQDNIIDVRDHPTLKSMLKVPPTGDSRALILNTKEGQEDRVIRYFEEELSAGGFVVERSRNLLSRGLFGLGRPTENALDRIGDLVAVPRQMVAVDNTDLHPRREAYPGRHGGLSEDEILVPLITRKL
jgi:hypothetical protein